LTKYNLIQFNTDQKAIGEDIALADAIQKTTVDNQSIVVFDKGLKKRKTFAAFNLEGRLFVTRINDTKSYHIIEEKNEHIGKTSKTLEIIAERYIRFYNGGVSTKKTAPFWRLVIAKSIETGELLYFLTNIMDLDALDITDIYRLRWDIEVFFRFLKQELNFTHLISRSINGIKVMAYVTLIAAMLILLYRQENKLKGVKIVKIKFANELQTELIKELIIFCGGDPLILQKITPN
jgi:IS4 transposase